MEKIFGPKYFLQVFGVFLVVMGFSYDMMFFFIQYPERNHDLVSMIAGAVNANMVTGVCLYFYGASKGGRDAQTAISDKMNANNPNKPTGGI